MNGLLLSIFPGIDVLGRAFEEEGYCVVRGPDRLWGGDIRSFHPPAGIFEGIIGGPPCQEFSILRRPQPHKKAKWGNLIPEFERVVAEAQPQWFVMENVRTAPIPKVEGYIVDPSLLNNRWLGHSQNRYHRFSFGTQNGARLLYDLALFESPVWKCRVLASGGPPGFHHVTGNHNLHLKSGPTNASVREALALQGLPQDFLNDAPFTVRAKQSVTGNAVAWPMAHALARAVKEATRK